MALVEVCQPFICDRFGWLMRVATDHCDLGSPCGQSGLRFWVKHPVLSEDQRGGYVPGRGFNVAIQPSLIANLAYALRYEVDRLSVDCPLKPTVAKFLGRHDPWEGRAEAMSSEGLRYPSWDHVLIAHLSHLPTEDARPSYLIHQKPGFDCQPSGGRLVRFLRFSSSSRASRSALGTARTCLTNSSNLARGNFGDPAGLLLAKGVLPDQLAVGDPLADNACCSRDESRSVGKLTRVEAVSGFVQVAVQVLGFDGVVSPVDHPLEQRPEVLKAVRVDAIPNVGFRVVDHLMNVIGLQSAIRVRRVRIDRGAGGDACPNLVLKGALSSAGDDPRPKLTVALKQAHDGDLAHPASPDVLLLVLMLEPRPAADKGFVGLNFTRKRCVKVADLHGKANPVRHEPRRLLSHAKVSRELVRRHALLESRIHPQRGEPLRKRDGRILEDRPLLDRELVFASLTAPQRTGRNEARFLAVTAHTTDAVGPAKLCYKVTADGLIREVSDGSDEGFGELRHD
jgi:hypothetical protein